MTLLPTMIRQYLGRVAPLHHQEISIDSPEEEGIYLFETARTRYNTEERALC